jgi:hypothetical protein
MQPRLYRFPPDSWITAIEIRGDDASADRGGVFRGPRGAFGAVPRRLIWARPSTCVTYHGLAWGRSVCTFAPAIRC